MRPLTIAGLALALALLCPLGALAAADSLAQAAAERAAGNIGRAIEILAAAHARAKPAQRAPVAGELGAALLQARRLDEAEPYLDEAVAGLRGAQRARYQLDLGNLAAYRRNPEGAQRHYREAIASAEGEAAIVLAARLNLARSAGPAERAAALAALGVSVPALPPGRQRAAFRLNLASQALDLGEWQLAYAQLEAARREAEAIGDARLQAEALDELARLYEGRGRLADAQKLNARAMEVAGSMPPGAAADLDISLGWRAGRLAAASGDADQALAWYQRAVESIEAVRPDIPIDYVDGRSSFKAMLEPAYLEYADLLLRKASRVPAAQRAPLLRQVRDSIERVRQAELQDYLRDRCEVEAVQRVPRTGVGPAVAVLYPIMFDDRLELLLETDAGIERRTSAAGAAQVRLTARRFAERLRALSEGYLGAARALDGWLLAPFEEVFRAQRIDTLVVVSEGSLRLVPFGALHDGKRFAIERFAIATVTGLTLTNLEAPAGGSRAALIAGMSVPGPVVDRLGQAGTASELRRHLALPGVKREVEAVSRIVAGERLLDEEFTVARFQREASSGDYRIVHIASHGVFGGSADASYIMAFDDVLTMGGLQSLLRRERFRRNPIELLSLSACQTAEGDERSPLGISGAAMKARAKSVLGTLWPVDDDSARIVMEAFYASLSAERSGKVKALQGAQVQALRTPQLSHPFFWAPFVLIGNWH